MRSGARSRGLDRRKALLAGASVVFVLAFAVAGAVASISASISLMGPRKGTPVVILSPHWEGIIKEFSRGFSEWMREKHGVDAYVDHLDVGGGTSTIAGHIESSFRAQPAGIDVDVLFGGGAARHASLARKGFLETVKLPPRVSAGLARDIGGMALRDPFGRWYGAAMSGFGIVWNKEVVRRMKLPNVRQWSDLTNPNLFGWVASGDPTSSGSVLAVFETILQACEQAYLTRSSRAAPGGAPRAGRVASGPQPERTRRGRAASGPQPERTRRGRGFEKGYGVITLIAANVAAFDVGGNSAARSVGLGQSAYGLSIDIYAYEQIARAGEDNVGFIMPSKHTVITPDPIAVIKGAPHPELARRFVEFVLCEEGQKLWYVRAGEEGGPKQFGLNRLPVLRSLYDSGLETGVTVNPFTWDGGFKFDQSLARQRGGVLAALVRSTLIDPHSALRECWRAVIAAGEPKELTDRLCEPPVTNEELLELAKTWWADPGLRQEHAARWSRLAREKYRSVREEAERR